jgi:hypothetical protein
VRTVAVIVLGVLGQDAAQMPLAEDQHVVQALTAKRPREPLRVGIARGDRTGVLITYVPFPEKTSSNAAVNLPSLSRTRNRNRPARSPRSSLDLHHEQHVHALEQDSIDVQEVAGQDAVCLSFQELPPCRRRPPRRGAEPGGGQDPADRPSPTRYIRPTRSPWMRRSPNGGSAAPSAPGRAS